MNEVTIILSASDIDTLGRAAADAIKTVPLGQLQRGPYAFRLSRTLEDWVVSVAKDGVHLLDIIATAAGVTITPQRAITPFEVMHIALALATIADPTLRIGGITV